MSLEKDIHQNGFRNEYHKALLNILHTYSYLVSEMNELFKSYDITRQQYNVLRILKGQLPGHASIILIRERMIDKMSDVSRIVERLRMKELIVRQYTPKDKRSAQVTISLKGVLLLDEMEESVSKLDSLLSTINEYDIRQLNNILDKIRSEKIPYAKEKLVV